MLFAWRLTVAKTIAISVGGIALAISTVAFLTSGGGVLYSAGFQGAKVEQNCTDNERQDQQLREMPQQIAQQFTEFRNHIDGKFDKTNERIDRIITGDTP